MFTNISISHMSHVIIQGHIETGSLQQGHGGSPFGGPNGPVLKALFPDESCYQPSCISYMYLHPHIVDG